MLFLENILQIKLSCSSSFTDVVKKPMKVYINYAGYDLSADESIEVLPNSRALISTGLKMQMQGSFMCYYLIFLLKIF